MWYLEGKSHCKLLKIRYNSVVCDRSLRMLVDAKRVFVYQCQGIHASSQDEHLDSTRSRHDEEMGVVLSLDMHTSFWGKGDSKALVRLQLHLHRCIGKLSVQRGDDD